MRTSVTATFLLAAIAVPVQAVAARGDSGGSLTPPPSSGRAPAPASPATGGASGPARGTIPAPAPRPARRSVPASARAPLLAPAPSARAPAPAPARGGATVPAPGPPPSQPLPEAQSSPTPNIEGFESPRKPEREWLPDKIILDEVPALVPQNQLARTAAALPSGDEPQLVQIARVRDKQKDGGGDVQVPLDGGRPARPAPSAPAQPAQLPRTGLDVVPLAAMGFAMMLAGLAVLRVSRLGRAAARQPTG
jgi:hypothetical protein